MARYLIDCNHLSEMLDKVSVVRDRMYQALHQGHRFVTCLEVVCELEAGIQQTAKLTENRRRLAGILRDVKLWAIDKETTVHFGTIFNELKKKGCSLSQIDFVIAALARQHRLIILTTDRDFEALPDLKTENWTV